MFIKLFSFKMFINVKFTFLKMLVDFIGFWFVIYIFFLHVRYHYLSKLLHVWENIRDQEDSNLRPSVPQTDALSSWAMVSYQALTIIN